MSIAVTVPLMFRKRGGRKLVVTPDGAPWAPRPRVDNAMVKALARAFRWRKMLDDGRARDAGGPGQGARASTPTYVSRVLRLTLLAPEIVEAILDGRQPAELQLDDLLAQWVSAGVAGPTDTLCPSLTDYEEAVDGIQPPPKAPQQNGTFR